MDSLCNCIRFKRKIKCSKHTNQPPAHIHPVKYTLVMPGRDLHFIFAWKCVLCVLNMGEKKPEYTERTESKKTHKNCYGFIRDTNENNDEQVFFGGYQTKDGLRRLKVTNKRCEWTNVCSLFYDFAIAISHKSVLTIKILRFIRIAERAPFIKTNYFSWQIKCSIEPHTTTTRVFTHPPRAI